MDLREQTWKNALLDLLLVNRVDLVREVEIGHPWDANTEGSFAKIFPGPALAISESLEQIAY